MTLEAQAHACYGFNGAVICGVGFAYSSSKFQAVEYKFKQRRPGFHRVTKPGCSRIKEHSNFNLTSIWEANQNGVAYQLAGQQFGNAVKSSVAGFVQMPLFGSFRMPLFVFAILHRRVLQET